ncbi:MAG: hypothetical protein OXT09_03505 [Myxococcales bacterium]|nr:hypothetical protein [Myxococcales bacterium]
MQERDPERRGTYLREGLIWLGFGLLLAVAAATVAVPELSEDPEQEAADDEPDAGT